MIPALRDKAVTPRYAVYWTPPADHPLWRAGCDWLGRDAERAQVDRPGEGPEALTRAPRRYGFHATLKAPMRLRGAADTHTFITAVATLALRHREFTMPPLQVDRLGDFVALRPHRRPAAGTPLAQAGGRLRVLARRVACPGQ
jgi:hypothetical protein